MRRAQRITTAIVTGLLLITSGLALAAEKQTQQATITANRKATYNWKTGEIEFSGGCRVEIKGEDKSVMTSERISGKFSADGNRIERITASGPVHFDITEAKDTEGRQRIITADCKGDAQFLGDSRIVKLTGGAEAVMSTIPQPPNSQPAKLTGQTIIIDMNTFDVTVEGPVHMEVEIPPTTSAPQQ
ncbi:MAG: hypothetical protein HPY44_16640 [Armatimonadetes bacterium]|nr:hypothetical protein [Armatimonadota bacterium]